MVVFHWGSFHTLRLTPFFFLLSFLFTCPIFTPVCTSSKLVAQSCLCNPMDYSPADSCPWDSPGKNTGVGCHFLLKGIFPTQKLNSGLLHCRKIIYLLSYQGSPAPQNQYLVLHVQIPALFSWLPYHFCVNGSCLKILHTIFVPQLNTLSI